MTEPTVVTTKPKRADPEVGAPPVLVAPPRVGRWIWLALGFALLAVLAVLFSFNPAHHSFYPFCAFHRVTGWQCPGCGGLRAVHHLLHGEVVTAFRFNQLVVLAAPFAVWFAVRRWLRGPRLGENSLRAQARWAWIALAVLIVFWIVRNLPLEIFRLPAE